MSDNQFICILGDLTDPTSNTVIKTAQFIGTPQVRLDTNGNVMVPVCLSSIHTWDSDGGHFCVKVIGEPDAKVYFELRFRQNDVRRELHPYLVDHRVGQALDLDSSELIRDYASKHYTVDAKTDLHTASPLNGGYRCRLTIADEVRDTQGLTFARYGVGNTSTIIFVLEGYTVKVFIPSPYMGDPQMPDLLVATIHMHPILTTVVYDIPMLIKFQTADLWPLMRGVETDTCTLEDIAAKLRV